MAITPQQAQNIYNQSEKAKVQTKLASTIEEHIDSMLKTQPSGCVYVYNIRTPCNKETFEHVVKLYQNAGWYAATNGSNTITISKKPECDGDPTDHFRGHCSCRRG